MKIKHVMTGVVVSSLLACAIGASAAEKIAPKTLEFLESTQISGYVQTSYQYGFNRRGDQTGIDSSSQGVIPARGFDHQGSSFDINQVKLTLEKPLDESDYSAGYRVDLLFGSDARIIHSRQNTAFNEQQSGNTFDIGNDGDLEQAYVQFRLPVGNGLDVKFGKFVTLLGNEAIDAPANWNFSHSYIFLYGLPFTHTGALASYKFNDMVDAQVGVVNGWDNVQDNNSGKTVIGRVGVTLLGGKLVFASSAIGGPENTGDGRNYRWTVDEIITFNVNEKLSLALEGVYGRENIDTTNNALLRDSASWWGAAGYAKFQWTSHFSTAFRAEYFADDGGFRTGLGRTVGVDVLPGPFGKADSVNYQEYTLSAQLDNVWKNLTPRVELRYDHVNEEVFGGPLPDGVAQSAFTISFDMIYVF
jgi:Putative beta-barrel porin-2, OmpL-like. bbp2